MENETNAGKRWQQLWLSQGTYSRLSQHVCKFPGVKPSGAMKVHACPCLFLVGCVWCCDVFCGAAVHVSAGACVCVCVDVYVSMCMYVCVHVHVHIFAYVTMCFYVYLCASKLVSRAVSVLVASPCVLAKCPHAQSMWAFCRHGDDVNVQTEVFQRAVPHTAPHARRTPHTGMNIFCRGRYVQKHTDESDIHCGAL